MPETPKIPLGQVIEDIINWLTENLSWLFDGISAVGEAAYEAVFFVLFSTHTYLMILIFAALAFLATRRVALPIFTVLAFLLIDSVGMWEDAMKTLALIIFATLFALLMGVPIGIWAARASSVSVTVRPILDFMQTLPVFVYLIPVVFFFGIGVVPGLMATIAFALPPAVRLTELGIRQVDEEVVEAAHAFGSRPGQVLREVQVPLAMPSIMAGVNQVIMLALSMVVVAGMVGTEGLGQAVVGSVQNLDIAGGFESGIAVVLLAIYLDRLTGGVSRLSQRRGRKKQKSSGAPAEQPWPVEAEAEKKPGVLASPPGAAGS